MATKLDKFINLQTLFVKSSIFLQLLLPLEQFQFYSVRGTKIVLKKTPAVAVMLNRLTNKCCNLIESVYGLVYWLLFQHMSLFQDNFWLSFCNVQYCVQLHVTTVRITTFCYAKARINYCCVYIIVVLYSLWSVQHILQAWLLERRLQFHQFDFFVQCITKTP